MAPLPRMGTGMHVRYGQVYHMCRDGEYDNATGQSFRNFMRGKLPAAPGQFPTEKDWAGHVGSVYPEASPVHPPLCYLSKSMPAFSRRCAACL